MLAPIARPTLVAFSLFSVVYHWNDFFWPLVMTTTDAVRTLPIGVAMLREEGTGDRWHIIMAGTMFVVAPVLAVFIVAQRYIIRASSPRSSRILPHGPPGAGLCTGGTHVCDGSHPCIPCSGAGCGGGVGGSNDRLLQYRAPFESPLRSRLGPPHFRCEAWCSLFDVLTVAGVGVDSTAVYSIAKTRTS